MFSPNLFRLALTAFYCAYCSDASDPLKPTHLWPLTSQTFGYDSNNAHATLVFADAANFESDGFVLDGKSFVDLPIGDTLGKGYTVSMCVRLAEPSEGVLLQYVKRDTGLVTFTVSVRTNRLWCGRQSGPVVPRSTTWIRLNIVRKDGNSPKLIVKEQNEVNCEGDNFSVPGKIRIGAAVNYTNYLEGKISCLRIYGEAVQKDCLSSKTGGCDICDSSKISGKLPEPPKTYNRGYFQVVTVDGSPDCNDCDFVNTTVRRTGDCGSLCLQHGFCISFSVTTKQQQLPIHCLLYPHVFTKFVRVQGMSYYKARLRQP